MDNDATMNKADIQKYEYIVRVMGFGRNIISLDRLINLSLVIKFSLKIGKTGLTI